MLSSPTSLSEHLFFQLLFPVCSDPIGQLCLECDRSSAQSWPAFPHLSSPSTPAPSNLQHSPSCSTTPSYNYHNDFPRSCSKASCNPWRRSSPLSTDFASTSAICWECRDKAWLVCVCLWVAALLRLMASRHYPTAPPPSCVPAWRSQTDPVYPSPLPYCLFRWICRAVSIASSSSSFFSVVLKCTQILPKSPD